MALQLQHFLLYIHLIAFCGALVGIIQADESAFAWLTGKRPLLDRIKMEQLHVIVSIALALLMVTGIWLFWPMRAYLLGNIFFLAKLFFVGLLVINSVLIEYLMPIASEKTFAEVPLKKKTMLALSGAVSTTSWAGALLAAYIVFGWLF